MTMGSRTNLPHNRYEDGERISRLDKARKISVRGKLGIAPIPFKLVFDGTSKFGNEKKNSEKR